MTGNLAALGYHARYAISAIRYRQKQKAAPSGLVGGAVTGDLGQTGVGGRSWPEFKGASVLEKTDKAALATVQQPEPPSGDFMVAYAHLPVSALMLHLARDWPRDRITLGEMIHAFGTRGYGLLIILFAIPNLIPLYIPGWSPIFGIPLFIVCAQLALGLPEPRLPAFLTRRSLRRSDLLMIVEKSMPWLKRIERFVRPRPSFLTGWLGARMIGAYGAFLAAIVCIPLPLTNGPTSLACAIMAFGLIEEDTGSIVAGAIVGIGATLLALSIIGGVGWVLGQGLAVFF